MSFTVIHCRRHHQLANKSLKQVCDALEDDLTEGGTIVDYHGCDFFPERWFDLVIVLQTDNTVLWGRLEKRGYKDKKIQDNVQCEIMNVIVEEARESYAEDIVHCVSSNTVDEMEQNVERLAAWAAAWRPPAAGGGGGGGQ